MAVILEKTYVLPEIVSHRSTCLGEQYTVVTPEFTDVVTVNGDKHTCTCGSSSCEHILVVKRQRTRNALANAKREAYCNAFVIYA